MTSQVTSFTTKFLNLFFDHMDISFDKTQNPTLSHSSTPVNDTFFDLHFFLLFSGDGT